MLSCISVVTFMLEGIWNEAFFLMAFQQATKEV